MMICSTGRLPVSLRMMVVGVPLGRYRIVLIASLKIVCSLLFSSLVSFQLSQANVKMGIMMVFDQLPHRPHFYAFEFFVSCFSQYAGSCPFHFFWYLSYLVTFIVHYFAEVFVGCRLFHAPTRTTSSGCLSSPEWTTIWLYNCEMIKDSGCQLLSIEFTGMRILEINFKIKVLEWSQIYDNFDNNLAV